MKTGILFILLPLIWLAAQENIDLSRDTSRYEKFSVADVRQVAEDLDINPRNVIQEIEKMLNEFYLSDPSLKKTQQQQDVNVHRPFERDVKREWNVNLTRLFMRNLLSKSEKPYLIKEAPNLFEMHYTLAKAYLKTDRPLKASFHHAMALRYRSLRMSLHVFRNKDREKLLDSNNPELQTLNSFEETEKNFKKSQKDLKTLKEAVIVGEDNLLQQEKDDENAIEVACSNGATNCSGLQTQLQNSRNQMKNQLEQNRARLTNQKQSHQRFKRDFEIFDEEYKKIEQKYNRYSSKFLQDTASLIKKIEVQIKERQKIINKKVLYKTSFNQSLVFDYSLNRQFAAYANLMEMASRLDPDNPQIPFSLAEEYRTSRLADRAIDSYEKAIDAQQRAQVNQKLPDISIASSYNSLGGLYYHEKHFVKSARNYEKALASTSDNKVRARLSFELAKIHTEKTGNYKRALSLITPLIENIEKKNPTDVEDRGDWLKKKFTLWYFRSQIFDRKKEMKNLAAALLKTIEAHSELEQLIQTQRVQVRDLFKKMQESKLPLLEETRQKALSDYTNNQIKYESEKSHLERLYALRHSLPLRNVYFSLTHYYQYQHNLTAALATLRQAEKLGIAPDEARRYMNRLKNQ